MPEEGSVAVADAGSAPAPPAPPAPAAPAAPAAPVAPPTDSVIADVGPPSAVAPTGSYVNADGTFTADWANRLPEDMAPARDKLGHYKSVTELAKALHNANQMIGRKGVIVPTKDSSPEEVAAYRKSMGVPEKPEDYAQMRPQDVNFEGFNWSPELESVYFKFAHDNNIPAETMRGLMALHAKQLSLYGEAQQRTISDIREKGQAELRRSWGPDFAHNLGLAQRVAAYYRVDPNDNGFNPTITKLIVEMAKDMSEDKFVGTSSIPAGMHDMIALAEDIQRNPNNPDHKKYWDGDPQVQAKVRRLREQGTPRTPPR